jgi:hypothetical protein
MVVTSYIGFHFRFFRANRQLSRCALSSCAKMSGGVFDQFHQLCIHFQSFLPIAG